MRAFYHADLTLSSDTQYDTRNAQCVSHLPLSVTRHSGQSEFR